MATSGCPYPGSCFETRRNENMEFLDSISELISNFHIPEICIYIKEGRYDITSLANVSSIDHFSL